MKYIIGLLIFLVGLFFGFVLVALLTANKISELERQVYQKGISVKGRDCNVKTV